MRTHRLIPTLSVLFALACASSHDVPLVPDPLPDVPRSTRVGELSEAEFRELCDWREALTDGEDVFTCADGRTIRHYGAEQCYEGRTLYPPECPVLLGDFVDCVSAMVGACRAGMLRDSYPECEDTRSCPPWDM